MLRSIFYCNILILIFLVSPAFGQVTSVFQDPDQYYEKGMDLYKKGNFGLAKTFFLKSEESHGDLYDDRSQLLKKEAKFMIAKSALEGQFPEGEKLIVDFYRQYNPDPLALKAIKEIANLKYEQKLYAEAINYYEQINLNNLPKKDQQEVLFKKGYCYFVRKDFEAAKASFRPILGEDTDYYYQTYYYLGMVNFYQGDYERAVENFFNSENYSLYKSRTPYYIAQIYFAQKQYDKIISYIPAQLNLRDVQNKRELHHILGQTYFLKGSYQDALPHLEYYEQNSQKMRKEDFYQLAFTQYKLGQFEKAAVNFKELSTLDSKLGMISNNYLADCYLRIGNKEEARVSFKNVTDFDLDLDLQEEALFNYGKLSAELGYDRAAISSLMELDETSRFFNEAQNVLGQLFESSRDYSMVIKTIEGMPHPAPRIQEAYQKVCLERGIQLMNDGMRNDAKITFLKGAKSPINHFFSTLIYFNLADIFHQEGQYDNSIEYLNKYFTLQSIVNGIPATAAPLMANYIQAYNYLKKEEYKIALDLFNKSLLEMQLSGFQLSSDLRERRLFADATLRVADCYFTENQYDLASESYAVAAQIDFPGQDYAFFQRSMIKGLQNKPFEKIVILEQLVKTVPSSSFIDDAYFQMGETQFMLGNMREAELSYAKILGFKGRTNLITRALLKLGLIAYNRGDVNKATEYYTSLFKNNPNRTEAQEALIALEEIYIQDLGKADEFIRIVEENTGYKMTNLERDSISYMAAQGKFDNGEYQEAINSYTRYIDNYPRGLNRLRAIYNRAESNSILKNYSAALPDYERLISIGQNEYYEEAIYKSALISYNDLKQFEKAFNYYMLLADVTSDRLLQYEGQVGALRSAFRAGNSEAILKMSAKVVNNELANKDDKALAYFLAGKTHYLKQSWDAALANLEQVPSLADNANAAEAKYLINDIYFQQEEFEKAETSTMEAIGNSTSYPYWVAKNLILLSDILMVNKDYFNARAALEAIIENFEENEEIIAQAKERLIKLEEAEAKQSRIEEKSETIELDTIRSGGE